jgi:hypothetical protein
MQEPQAFFARSRFIATYESYQMKRTKTKTEVIVATRQRITIRRRSQLEVWCDRCGETVEMFLPEHVALLTNTTSREIYRRVENGEVHFVETGEGELFICCRTLQLY